MEPTNNDRLEGELTRLSWWNQESPGLWKKSAAEMDLGRMRIRRSRWAWAVVGAAAALAAMGMLRAVVPGGTHWYAAVPDNDRAITGAAVPGSFDPAQPGDRVAGMFAGLPDAAADSVRLVLASAPTVSGPVGGGLGSNAGFMNFFEPGETADARISRYETPALAEAASGEGGDNFVIGDVDARFTQAVPTQPAGVNPVTAQRAFQIPAGKYTTLILGAHGHVPMFPVRVEMQRYGDRFPISAGPGSTYFIAFPEGWEVKEGEARVVITSTSAPGTPAADGFAWGLTARGPVAFPEQKAP